MDKITLISPNKSLKVQIDKGELISYCINSEEIIHQKGNPGWRNSDTEMFPLIGATSPNNYMVSTPRGECIQDQHGLLRELNYNVLHQTSNSATFQKAYQKNKSIPNSKFPDKSPHKTLFWPYDFEFKKCFTLSDYGLQIQFKIEAEKGMPYMLGYHPAFKLKGDSKEIIKTSRQEITIDEILEIGASAFPVLDTSEVILVKDGGPSIKIKTKGFQNFMLWTEVNNMLCIEPITFYPNATDTFLTPNMFRTLNKTEVFEVIISPFQLFLNSTYL